MNGRLTQRCVPIALAIIAALVASSDVTAAFKYLAEGMTAPAFEGQDLRTGEKVDYREMLGEGDRATVVAFWATWSERSLELFEDLVEYAREEERPLLEIVAVNVEGVKLTAEQRAEVEATVAAIDPPFPVIIDEGLEIFNSYGVVAVPSTAVVDGKGILRYGPAGYSYFIRDQLVDSVATLIGEETFAPIETARQYVPENEASRYYNLARQLVLRGMHDRALENLDHASEIDPGFASVDVLRGEVFLVTGDPGSAVAAYELAVTKDELLVPAWTGLGLARVCAEEGDAAETALRKASELDPAYTPAMVGLARCRIQAGDFDEALALVQEVGQLVFADPELDFLLGEIRRGEGNQQAALEAYESALQGVFPASWDPRGSRR